MSGFLLQCCSEAQQDERLLREWIRALSADASGGRKPMTEYKELTVNYLAGVLLCAHPVVPMEKTLANVHLIFDVGMAILKEKALPLQD